MEEDMKTHQFEIHPFGAASPRVSNLGPDGAIRAPYYSLDRIIPLECSFVAVDYGIVAVDSDRPVIVRGWEGQYLPVKLLFAFYKSEEFNYTSYYKCHAMSILSIGDIKSRSAALYFAG